MSDDSIFAPADPSFRTATQRHNSVSIFVNFSAGRCCAPSTYPTPTSRGYHVIEIGSLKFWLNPLLYYRQDVNPTRQRLVSSGCVNSARMYNS